MSLSDFAIYILLVSKISLTQTIKSSKLKPDSDALLEKGLVWNKRQHNKISRVQYTGWKSLVFADCGLNISYSLYLEKKNTQWITKKKATGGSVPNKSGCNKAPTLETKEVPTNDVPLALDNRAAILGINFTWIFFNNRSYEWVGATVYSP